MVSAREGSTYYAAVEVKPLEDYQSGDYRLFLTEDSTAGFAISKDGDILVLGQHDDCDIIINK